MTSIDTQLDEQREAKFRSYIALSPDGVFVSDENGQYLEVNPAASRITGYSSEELLQMTIPDLLPSESKEIGLEHFKNLKEAGVSTGDFKFRHKNGEIRWWSVDAVKLSPTRYLGFVKDITARKNAEVFREMGQSILKALSDAGDLRSSIDRVLSVIKESMGTEAVGIRLQEGDDFPYYSHSGFSNDFIEAENSLLVTDPTENICKDDEGRICLDCTCGLVICGKADPSLAWFTRGGSAWTNPSCAGQAVAFDPRLNPRDRCLHEGYQSVALVPIRAKGAIVGLLQLNDRRKDLLNLATVEALESIAENIGEALLRKKAEEKLRKSRESYHSFISQSREAIYCTEFDNPVDISLPLEEQIDEIYKNAYMGECNLAMAKMYGLDSVEQMAGQRLIDFHGGKDNPINRETFRIFIRAGYRSIETETEEIAPNGQKRCFLCNDTGIVENGKLQRIWGTAIEISERKRAEESLRESEEKFSRAFITSPYAITITNAEDGKIIEVNDAFTQICGVPREEALNSTSIDLKLWHSNDDRQSVVDDLKAGKTVSGKEFLFRKRNGDLIYGIFSANIIKIGQKVCILSSINDITEYKKTEDEKLKLQAQLQHSQKMESVGRLAGGVAHDFNNMLGVIIGHCEMALSSVDPSLPVYDDLKEIRYSARRSAELTRQLLAFARKQNIAPKTLDLNETVSGMLKMLQRLIGEDISLKWHPQDALWSVNVDPAQVDQLLANLCVNARDAIKDTGSIIIETGNITFDKDFCSINHGFVEGEFVMLAISDDGCGMDKETMSHIFEPFYTTKDLSEGTGLGLATVYGIVNQNKGFINVYSEVNHGTTFKIYLPRDFGVLEKADEADEIQKTLGGTEVILLVEDEPGVNKMTTKMLQGLGYTVLSAANPDQALQMAQERQGPIHLLITDIILPGMNGRDLSKKLSALCPSMKRLFMSGYSSNVITNHGVIDAGINFLQKPFTTPELAVKVRRVLDS